MTGARLARLEGSDGRALGGQMRLTCFAVATVATALGLRRAEYAAATPQPPPGPPVTTNLVLPTCFRASARARGPRSALLGRMPARVSGCVGCSGSPSL